MNELSILTSERDRSGAGCTNSAILVDNWNQYCDCQPNLHHNVYNITALCALISEYN